MTGAAHNCAQLQQSEVTAVDGGLDGGDGGDSGSDGANRNPPWVCWGDNTYGQTTLPRPDVFVTAAGDKHTCGYTVATTAAGVSSTLSAGATTHSARPRAPAVHSGR